MNSKTPALVSPWPHRVSVCLVCATFVLIWIGGLVTTYDAGMAVNDWPTTFGENMFLYRWDVWLTGPWDVFIEHGHRLFAAGVGLATIVLAAVLCAAERRRWVRALGVAAVFAVVLQGVLGGMRVLENETRLAMLHGCLGAAFFGLCVALAVFTSRRWREVAESPPSGEAPPGETCRRREVARFQRLAVLTCLLAYFQIVLGAAVRHIPSTAAMHEFQAMLLFHLFFAAVLAGHIVLLTARCWRRRKDLSSLWRPALLLVVFLLVQLCLGAVAWVTNYGWPVWFSGYAFADGYTILRGGALQAMVTTAHVAIGSLIFVTALALALRSMRLPRGDNGPSLEAAA